MEYIKRLIILTGERGRGAVTVETTAAGSICRTSVKERSGERLYLAVKEGERCFVERLKDAIALPFTPTEEAHYIVIDADLREPVLYGTQSRKRLWRANMADGVMKYVVEKQRGESAPQSAASERKNAFSQTPDEKKIKYDDEAIAMHDYYPEGYGKTTETGGFCRFGERKRTGFSEATRGFLEQYNRGLREKNMPQRGFFALQRKYVLGAEPNAFARVRKTDSKRVSVRSIKSFAAAGSSSAARVVPVAADFYDEIRRKMEKLFADAEKFDALEKHMPDTRWVRVPYEKSGYYAVGIIGSRPDYIAYGLPGIRGSGPPEELGNGARWWPLDPQKPDGEGVWILYQDARTGDSVADPW